MTDFSIPPDDEIVSAHLDGEASSEEAARVEADPRARDRLAAFDAVRAAVAGPVTPEPGAREHAIAAALDVFDREVAPLADHHRTAAGVEGAGAGAGDEAAGTSPSVVAPLTTGPWPGGDGRAPTAGATVTDLATRRSRRGLQLLSAAAVILVVIGALAVLRLGQRSSLDVTQDAGAPLGATTTANAKSPSAVSAGPEVPVNQSSTADDRSGQPAAGSSPASAPPFTGLAPTTAATPRTTESPTSATTESVPLVDLGTVATTDALEHTIAAALAAGSNEGGPTKPVTDPAVSGQVHTCDAALRGTDFEIGALTFTGVLTYEGRAGFALLYAVDQSRHPAVNGPARLYVVDRSCAVIEVDTL